MTSIVALYTPSHRTLWFTSSLALCTCVLGETGKGSLIGEESSQLGEECTSVLSAPRQRAAAMSKPTGDLACHSGWEGSGRPEKQHFQRDWGSEAVKPVWSSPSAKENYLSSHLKTTRKSTLRWNKGEMRRMAMKSLWLFIFSACKY